MLNNKLLNKYLTDKKTNLEYSSNLPKVAELFNHGPGNWTLDIMTCNPILFSFPVPIIRKQWKAEPSLWYFYLSSQLLFSDKNES